MGANSKVLLIDEHRSEPLKLVESVATPTGQYTNGVIATLYGTLSDFRHETRNDRWYTEELWNQVFKSDLFNEALKTKTLFGEADHPLDVEDRLETHIPYVSHIVRDPKINHDKGVVEGYLDILDTPNGRIVKTLIDYGCELGVSSRGSGDLTYDGGRTLVDKDTYNFVTWDIVARPSNKQARVHELDTVDSTGKTAFESLQTQIKSMVDSRNTQSLRLTEGLISNTEIPDKDKVLKIIRESIEKVEKPTPEPIFTEEGQEVDKTYLLKDLDEAYNRITELRRQNEELDIKNKSLERSLEDSKHTVEELTDLNKNLSSMVSNYMDTLSSESAPKSTINEGDSEDDDLNDSSTEIDVINKIADEVASRLMSGIDTKIGEVIDQSSKVTEKVDKYLDGIKEQEGIDELDKQLKTSQKEVDRLSKSLKNSQNENIRLIRKISNVMNEYFKIRCDQLGLNESLVRKEFQSSRLYEYDLNDIEDVLNEKYSQGITSLRLNESVDDASVIASRTTGKSLGKVNIKSPYGKDSKPNDNSDESDEEDYSEDGIDQNLLESIRGVKLK